MSASPLELANTITLGDGYEVEPGVILGYLPGRRIANVELSIGPGARIRSGTVIYAGSTLCHITIGEGALIGAGSVVTRDIPAHSVAYGNPARPLKSVDELPCPLGLVERPYVNGFDVQARQAAGRS